MLGTSFAVPVISSHSLYRSTHMHQFHSVRRYGLHQCSSVRQTVCIDFTPPVDPFFSKFSASNVSPFTSSIGPFNSLCIKASASVTSPPTNCVGSAIVPVSSDYAGLFRLAPHQFYQICVPWPVYEFALNPFQSSPLRQLLPHHVYCVISPFTHISPPSSDSFCIDKNLPLTCSAPTSTRPALHILHPSAHSPASRSPPL